MRHCRKSLDLFCGAGGASKGLADAGFEVTGIDIIYQSFHPANLIESVSGKYKFLQRDVMMLTVDFFRQFDFIWASPPCPTHSRLQLFPIRMRTQISMQSVKALL